MIQRRSASDLPVFDTPLVAADTVLRDLAEEVRRAAGRCVTVVGPGGVGKTRLAVEVASSAHGRTFDDVVFVALDEVATADTMASRLALARDAARCRPGREAPGGGSTAGDRYVLLVLDTVERVVGAARVVDAVLDADPHLVVLATSRRPLGAAHEVLVRVAPLPVPDPDARFDAFLAEPAVELLVTAARRHDPSFTLEANDVAAVVEICRRLDGVPLALELAAFRLQLMDPPELVPLLDRRFDVLRVPTDRGRHGSLRASIDWSYRLLDDEDRRRFRSLAAFTESFSLAAAAAVLDDDVVNALEALARLVDQHLVTTGRGADRRGRFRMLESVREFAAIELGTSDELEAVRQRHATWHADPVVPLLPSASVGGSAPNPGDLSRPIDAELLGLGLSRREAEVARMLADRRTDREIAAVLFISPRTVESHVAAVLRKLEVRSRRDVAGLLTDLGVAAPPSDRSA